MKKVLALVLAVIMVCTMAFAVTVGGANPYETTDPNSNAQRMAPVTPGASLIFTSTELNAADIAKASDYTVKITFAKGAELVASHGWVENPKGTFVYAVTTKGSTTAVQDDVADIVISSIEVYKTGVKNPVLAADYTSKNANKEVTYAYYSTEAIAAPLANSEAATYFGYAKLDDTTTVAVGSKFKFAFAWDYGYKHADLIITENGSTTVSTGLESGTIYTAKRAAAAGAASSAGYVTALSGFVAGYSMKAGEKVLFANIGTLPVAGTNASNKLIKNELDNDVTVKGTLENVVLPYKAVTLTFDGAKDGYKMYMVNADGSVVDLNAKFDANKVLTATAVLTGPVIVTDKALTATGTAAGSTTTNPGTGANDVVGVAAALAVVALVSGAAISLKK